MTTINTPVLVTINTVKSPQKIDATTILVFQLSRSVSNTSCIFLTNVVGGERRLLLDRNKMTDAKPKPNTAHVSHE